MNFQILMLIAFIISPIVVTVITIFQDWFQSWLVKGENK